MDACGLADTTSPRPPLLPHPLLPRMSPLRLPLVPSAPGDERCRERACGRGRGPPLSPPAIAHLELTARATCKMRRRKRRIQAGFLGRISISYHQGYDLSHLVVPIFEDSPPRTQGSVGYISAIFLILLHKHTRKISKKKPGDLNPITHFFIFDVKNFTWETYILKEI